MQLAYDRIGAGPPLVLIHGIGSRRGVWKPVVPLLAGERGSARGRPAGLRRLAAARDGAADGRRARAGGAGWWGELGLERPHVAGNSLGGGIALELARMGVVSSATALSPIGFWSPGEAR